MLHSGLDDQVAVLLHQRFLGDRAADRETDGGGGDGLVGGAAVSRWNNHPHTYSASIANH